MKTKLIGNAILMGATAFALPPHVAVAVVPDGTTTTSVVQVSKDVDKASFVNRLAQSFRTMAASESLETRTSGVQYLEALQQPGIYGRIEQTSIPAFSGNEESISSMHDAPPQPGTTRTSQWCGPKSGYTYVYQVTETYMAATPDSQANGWVQTNSSSRMVTTCPGDLA